MHSLHTGCCTTSLVPPTSPTTPCSPHHHRFAPLVLLAFFTTILFHRSLSATYAHTWEGLSARDASDLDAHAAPYGLTQRRCWSDMRGAGGGARDGEGGGRWGGEGKGERGRGSGESEGGVENGGMLRPTATEPDAVMGSFTHQHRAAAAAAATACEPSPLHQPLWPATQPGPVIVVSHYPSARPRTPRHSATTTSAPSPDQSPSKSSGSGPVGPASPHAVSPLALGAT